ALGVDTSAAAVAMTTARGGTALHQNLFAPVPSTGQWDRVLLADGNIGIGGDPVQLLRRARELLAPNGVLIIEGDSSPMGLHRERLRVETEHQVGHWFPWATVGADVLGDLAHAAGLTVIETSETSNRIIVQLRRSTH
ncbi:MAG: SAM-dependent methyltransferase, partial [Mycobacteriales bacterium]